jgi:hypothetical protein
VLYHSKAVYLRLGNEKFHPLEVNLGIEMATTFGGTTYLNGKKTKHPAGITKFIKAFLPLKENGDSVYTAEGNMLGSMLLSVGYKFNNWKLRAYIDHYFEDGSQMFLLDYDGYGSGKDWDKREKHRYLLYDPKDAMYGIEVTLPKNSFVSTFVAEYLYTKYQSGPVYHDHSEDVSDHIGGRDGYYNHGTYVGWQHWGQVIGNPLYLSPVYNDDGSLSIKNNRFVAYHFGICGAPATGLHYRLLMTWQKGWGTYDIPYTDVKKSYSLLTEIKYDMPEKTGNIHTDGWDVKVAFGIDHGELRGNNTGLQITIIKKGILNFKRK